MLSTKYLNPSKIDRAVSFGSRSVQFGDKSVRLTWGISWKEPLKPILRKIRVSYPGGFSLKINVYKPGSVVIDISTGSAHLPRVVFVETSGGDVIVQFFSSNSSVEDYLTPIAHFFKH